MEPLLSQDGDSSSYQQPSAIRLENKNKFVPGQSGDLCSHKDVKNKIDSIRSGFASLCKELDVVEDALWWRTKSGKELKYYSIKLLDLQRPLTEKVEALSGFIGVHKQIPYIKEKSFIEEIVTQAKLLEIELLLAQKKLKKLQKLCQCKPFRTIHDFGRIVIVDLVALMSGPEVDKVALFKQKEKVIVEKCTAIDLPEVKSAKRAIKERQLEILEICLIAANTLSLQAVGVLNPEIRNLEAVIVNVKVELKPKEPSKALIQKRQAANDIAQQVNARYSFWARVPTTIWASFSLPGWRGYESTGNFGQKLEKEVAQKLGGLLDILQIRLVQICQGDLADKSLDDENSYYICCYYEIKAQFEQCRHKFESIPFDALTPAVVDYMHGLKQVFAGVREYLALLQKCVDKPGSTVLKSLQAMRKQDVYVSDDVRLSSALQLYPAARQIQQAMGTLKFGKKSFDQYIQRTHDLLYEVHATNVPEIVALTDAESRVADHIFGKQPLAALYYPSETRIGLPSSVMAFIVKRVEQFLFLPSDFHDVELELVLHHVRADTSLRELYEQSQWTFKNLVDDYDAHYKSRRFHPVKELQPALEVLNKIVSAKDVADYAESWQMVREYVRTVPKDVSEPISRVLFGKLKNVSEKNGYPFLHSAIYEPDIETWRVEEFIHVERRLRIISEQLRPSSVIEADFQRLFDALVLRMLSQAVYAKNYNEQVVVQKKIESLLWQEGFQHVVAELSDCVKKLICENAVRKLSLCSFGDGPILISTYEYTLLEEGPLEQFYVRALSLQEDARIGMVLYKMIKAEKTMDEDERSLTETFKTRMKLSDFEFDRWFAGYENVAQAAVWLK